MATPCTGTPTDIERGLHFSSAPGGYTVCETVPAGYTQIRPDLGPDLRGTRTAGGAGTITLTSGSTDSGNDFGNFRNGTKSGTKFDDLNANGAADPVSRASKACRSTCSVPTGGATRSTCTPPPMPTAASSRCAPGTYTACETVPAATRSRTRRHQAELGGRDVRKRAGWDVPDVRADRRGNDFGNFAERH